MTLLGPFSFGPWLDSALEPAALQPNASEIRSVPAHLCLCLRSLCKTAEAEAEVTMMLRLGRPAALLALSAALRALGVDGDLEW